MVLVVLVMLVVLVVAMVIVHRHALVADVAVGSEAHCEFFFEFLLRLSGGVEGRF